MKSNLFSISFFLLFIFLFSIQETKSQNKIHWLNFSQLEDSIASKPKKVFLYFYADWCAYCKKMDKAAFKNSEIINLLNNHYYAVKMDVQSKDTISFGKEIFVNKEFDKKRQPIHQIPLLLASRNGSQFSLPAMIILDESFKVKKRYFEYLSQKKMENFLSKK